MQSAYLWYGYVVLSEKSVFWIIELAKKGMQVVNRWVTDDRKPSNKFWFQIPPPLYLSLAPILKLENTFYMNLSLVHYEALIFGF